MENPQKNLENPQNSLENPHTSIGNPQISMENRRHKNNTSGDKFSFPTMSSIQDQEFEFGSFSTSPSSSPADHLFFNGRLLPHTFPFHHNISIYSRSTSRTSSVSSKDSLMSSRSNSINSRNSSSSSSNCSSARTSISEAASDQSRKVLLKQGCNSYQTKRVVLNRQYSSSQGWQFIKPAPVLTHHQVSAGLRKNECRKMKSKKHGEKKTSSKAWFGKRVFMAFVSACKECHAIKPSSRQVFE